MSCALKSALNQYTYNVHFSKYTLVNQLSFILFFSANFYSNWNKFSTTISILTRNLVPRFQNSCSPLSPTSLQIPLPICCLTIPLPEAGAEQEETINLLSGHNLLPWAARRCLYSSRINSFYSAQRWPKTDSEFSRSKEGLLKMDHCN